MFTQASTNKFSVPYFAAEYYSTFPNINTVDKGTMHFFKERAVAENKDYGSVDFFCD